MCCVSCCWIARAPLTHCRSVESFERKMDETQAALGRDPQHFVPVVYHADPEMMKELLQ